jgi:hypothetical protein
VTAALVGVERVVPGCSGHVFASCGGQIGAEIGLHDLLLLLEDFTYRENELRRPRTHRE